MAIEQRDYDLLKSHNKRVSVKIILLDDNYQEVDSLSGRVTSASYNISAESDIRRTCTLTMMVPQKAQLDVDFRNTWIDRMVELHCGIYDDAQGDFRWYALGRMLMVDGRTTYDATAQEIQLSLVDLMACLTSSRGSQMGTDMLIPAGSNVRNVLASIVALFSPYKRYSIPEFEDVVPYDLTISMGQYPYDALKEVLNLFPYYEMFYDHEGVFTVQKIPTKTEDPIEIGSSVLDELLISETNSVKFSDVKNTTEIWGRSLDALYTATNVTSTGSRYDLTIDGVDALVVGDTYSFTPPVTSVAGQTMKIGETAEYGIYTEATAIDEETGEAIVDEETGGYSYAYTPIEAGAMTAGIPYCVRYADSRFILQGELEIHVIVQESKAQPSDRAVQKFKEDNACRDVQWVINADSPFACEENAVFGMDHEIRQVLMDGEYANIYTTELAFERARYENWKKTRLQDTSEISSIMIPWLDVNAKIAYTSPATGEVGTFLTQTIDFDFARWTMDVKCSRFYPYYPWE